MTLEETLRQIVREEIRAALRDAAPAPASTTGAPEELLSREQAAATVGVALTTIKRWMAAGDLPFTKKGRIVRVRRRDLEACIARSPLPGSDADIEERVDAILGKRH